jgi:hypothetical protein
MKLRQSPLSDHDRTAKVQELAATYRQDRADFLEQYPEYAHLLASPAGDDQRSGGDSDPLQDDPAGALEGSKIATEAPRRSDHRPGRNEPISLSEILKKRRREPLSREGPKVSSN